MIQNQTFFLRNILKADIIFHWSQNTKIFQWLLQSTSFNFIAKVSRNSKVKRN